MGSSKGSDFAGNDDNVGSNYFTLVRVVGKVGRGRSRSGSKGVKKVI